MAHLNVVSIGRKTANPTGHMVVPGTYSSAVNKIEIHSLPSTALSHPTVSGTTTLDGANTEPLIARAHTNAPLLGRGAGRQE